MGKKLTTEQFIEKAKTIHGNKYDYFLTDYKGAFKKVKIICPEHGIFEQIANLHIHKTKKQICPTSTKIIKNKKMSKTTEEFIKEAKAIHGGKYDYSLVDYKNSYTKVKIICPEHGIFKIQPRAFIFNKQSCSKCTNYIRKTTEEFIKEAEAIHGNKYNYSLVKYKGAKTKIEIICSKHGIFKQLPTVHINAKSGCPICNESKGEKAIARYLDNKNIQYIKEYKFNNCRNIKPLPFDFYLHERNILIEYDGKQHYENVKHFGGKEAFKQRKINDAIKTKYCIDNNIKLIRIRYDDNIIEMISL